MALHCEFPGGKVESDEHPENALRREIKEELLWSLGDLKPLTEVLHEYDFGTITAGRKVFREFQFTNTGNAPLLIANVHPQCGCTATKDWPKEPIKPGEGGTIKVEFDSTDRTGKQKKIIDVITNATPPTARLLLNGVVIGPDFTSEDI